VNRDTYDAIALDYHARANRIWPELPAAVARFAQAVPAGDWVADVGCGPGRDTALLRSAGLRAVGLDLSLGMLRAGGLAGMAQADMRALPVGSGALAGVWSCAALLHIPLAAAPGVLAEFARVVRPGGVLHLQVAEGDGEEWQYGGSQGRPRFFAHHREPELTSQLGAVGFAVYRVERAATHRNWLIIDAGRTP
jgi:SAM-dependent methyltransferase